MLPIEIENKRSEIRALVETQGAELVDIDYRRQGGRAVISVLADKPEGITLDDCAKINHALGELFEFLEGAYLLEVSSPGLDRPLVSERDFERNLGRKIRVTFRQESARVMVLSGTLVSMASGILELEMKDGSIRAIKLTQVIRAVREISFK